MCTCKLLPESREYVNQLVNIDRPISFLVKHPDEMF
jgi:hypothetical protein